MLYFIIIIIIIIIIIEVAGDAGYGAKCEFDLIFCFLKEAPLFQSGVWWRLVATRGQHWVVGLIK